MNILTALVTWAVATVFVDSFLWGLAGVLVLRTLLKRRQNNFFFEVIVLTFLHFLWDSVIFGNLINELDITIGNVEVANFLGQSKITFAIGFWDFLVSFLQMILGVAIGRMFLKKYLRTTN